MKMNDYQELTKKFDLFEQTDNYKDVAFVEKVLGLSGEAGEFSDKVKKVLRDKGGEIGDLDREGMIKELGDVLWYVAAIARYLGVGLEEIAKMNLDKLESRMERNKLHGAGDER